MTAEGGGVEEQAIVSFNIGSVLHPGLPITALSAGSLLAKTGREVYKSPEVRARVCSGN